MLRYGVLRLLIFCGALLLLWLLGLRDPDEMAYLIGGAAVLSMAVSFVALKSMRDEASLQIAHRVDARRQARDGRPSDEDAEDRESDRSGPDEGDFR